MLEPSLHLRVVRSLDFGTHTPGVRLVEVDAELGDDPLSIRSEQVSGDQRLGSNVGKRECRTLGRRNGSQMCLTR